TDAGGVVEDIEPGRNGTIIPFGDDGTSLAAAVIDAVAMLNRMQPGEAVVFDSGGIRFWEQQATELAGMLQGCVRATHRGAA
ncbi:MAG: hypothetical protein DWI27_02545, partial [Planctomycetota bacterium]